MRSLPIAAEMLALGIVMTPAAAQSSAEFYMGKTITIMLGVCPAICTHGALADHMKRLIPPIPTSRPRPTRLRQARSVHDCACTAESDLLTRPRERGLEPGSTLTGQRSEYT